MNMYVGWFQRASVTHWGQSGARATSQVGSARAKRAWPGLPVTGVRRVITRVGHLYSRASVSPSLVTFLQRAALQATAIPSV